MPGRTASAGIARAFPDSPPRDLQFVATVVLASRATRGVLAKTLSQSLARPASPAPLVTRCGQHVRQLAWLCRLRHDLCAVGVGAMCVWPGTRSERLTEGFSELCVPGHTHGASEHLTMNSKL